MPICKKIIWQKSILRSITTGRIRSADSDALSIAKIQLPTSPENKRSARPSTKTTRALPLPRTKPMWHLQATTRVDHLFHPHPHHRPPTGNRTSKTALHNANAKHCHNRQPALVPTRTTRSIHAARRSTAKPLRPFLILFHFRLNKNK